MRTLAVLAAAVLALTAQAAPAPLPKPDVGKEDLKKMQGAWLRLSCTGGTFPPVPRPINDIVVIVGNHIAYDIQKPSDIGRSTLKWALTLGSGKAPRTFDIKRGEGERHPQVWSGVYELKGDTLRVCFRPGLVRPRSIKPSRAGEYLQTFRRKKR
jgi:uncharacterized protein (TIGR03067 family)